MRHRLPTVLGLALAAMLAGSRSVYAIGQRVAGCSQKTLKAFDARVDPAGGRYVGPDEKTVRGLCARLDGDAVDAAVSRWLQRRVRSSIAACTYPSPARGAGNHGDTPMNTFLWIVQILLAVAFLAAGFIAVVRSKEQLKATGMGWVDDYGDRALKRIGAAEILGACGLALPALLGIAPILVPLAATGLQTPPQSRRPSSTRPASSRHRPFRPGRVRRGGAWRAGGAARGGD